MAHARRRRVPPLFVCYRTLTAAETARLRPVVLPLPVTIWTGDDYLAN
jgi:hypothetical protein